MATLTMMEAIREAIRDEMRNDPFDRNRKVQVILSDSQNSRLKQAARRSGVTKSAFVRVALERELALEDHLDLVCDRNLRVRQEKQSPRDQPRLFNF